MAVPAEFNLFLWEWSQVRKPTVLSGAVQGPLLSNTSLANGYSMKAGTSLNFISCLCQGSFRIKKVAAFSHPLKAFVYGGTREGSASLHLQGWAKKGTKPFLVVHWLGKKNPGKSLPAAFAHSWLLSRTFCSSGHKGGWVYSPQSPTPHQAQGRYFPILSPSSRLSSRADPGLFFSHWGCGKAACLGTRSEAGCPCSKPYGSADIPAFQILHWTVPIYRLWMTQMLFISSCWIFPFYFPGRGKRLIYSLCWGGKGQKQTVKRNSIFQHYSNPEVYCMQSALPGFQPSHEWYLNLHPIMNKVCTI